MKSSRWQFIASLVLIALFLWKLNPILPPFVVAILLAWAGNPVVMRLERAGRSRNTAVLLVFAMSFGLMLTALFIMVPVLWNQTISLIDGIPQLVAWAKTVALPWVGSKLHMDVEKLLDPTNAAEAVQSHWKEFSNFATLVLGYASQSGMALVVFFSNLLLLPILSFYFLRDWPLFIQRVHEMIPRAIEPKVVQITKESNEVLGGFLRGQLLVMIALGIIYGAGLWLIGLDAGLLIGAIAGLVGFVPYLGATIGVLAAVAASLMQYGGDIKHLLLIGVVFSVGQLLESFILTPRLVGDRIGLHPVTVIFAIMAGGQLFGFIGVLLALPVAAVVNVMISHARASYLKSKIYGHPLVSEQDLPTPPDV